VSPIRSNRGRSAVARSIWAWPLHNRTRAVITIILVIGVLLVIGRITSMWREDQDQAGPVVTPPSVTANPNQNTPSTNTASTDPIPAPSGPIPAMGPPAPQEALRAAAGFMRNWVHHPQGMTSTQWAENLGPYAMPELVGQLYSTEPGNVPATQLVGDPQVTRVTDAVVELNWRTDGPTVRLTLIHPHGPWLVNRLGVAE
jgi:hypothetical protein